MATEKMMTFEEWREGQLFKDGSDSHIYSEGAWKAAQIGMIPAENAVVIPDVGEWPEGAEAVYVGFYDKTVLVKKIAHIPRPKPVWVPKVGEAVFCLTGGYPSVIVGGFTGDVMGKLYTIRRPDATGPHPFNIRDLKPFHESHIGKPWSEIPGDPS